MNRLSDAHVTSGIDDYIVLSGQFTPTLITKVYKPQFGITVIIRIYKVKFFPFLFEIVALYMYGSISLSLCAFSVLAARISRLNLFTISCLFVF